MEVSLIRQPSAIAASTAKSTAFRFSTGRAPGRPRQTGHTFVFGGAPKRVEHEQKILEKVRSWTCTSNPITGSYLARAATDVSGVVAISRYYKGVPGLASLEASWAWRVRSDTSRVRRRKTSVRFPWHRALRSDRNARQRAAWKSPRHRRT